MRHKPIKSLGQNFLVDQNIRRKIITALDLKPADIVFEIGAGRGELTGLIAPNVERLFALEIDRRLYSLLIERLKIYSNLTLINRDILKCDLNKILEENKIESEVKVFGNIPYYISSPIIELLINQRGVVKEVFITVQKEFAKRVVALPGSKEYGSFSCFVQYYAIPEILFQINRGCFYPLPKVDSCFLRLRFRKKPAVSVKNEELLFKVIRAAFNQRRKTLKNTLKGKVQSEKLAEFFLKNNLNSNIRAEELSLAEFADLVNSLN
ncbi:MAG TPA: 16S rRNA (adenine(1518)-N(6)/adenine(1519)-N(6))-dimethyltransferase RsmA [Candidatus Omnitrophota bacterium]|nr:16S rRNA (adenine(1518)-N(6)/adenine(1519)-N(6))-dimethyltransferase RsmA [Candidatus Omnitrophota bacterium]